MEPLPRPADLEMVGLSFDPDGLTGSFELVPSIARHDGGLYGGTAIAASVVAMEAATQRNVLWLTTQYVDTARQGDSITCTTDVLKAGRNVSQVQVTGRTNDRVLFLSIGSTAMPRESGLEGQYLSIPVVQPPEECEPMVFGIGMTDGFQGFTEQVEYRLATTPTDETDTAQLVMWSRLNAGRSVTPAAIAFMADMVPGAIARAAGLVGGGTSLDNSLRFGRSPVDQEWVLLELRGEMAVSAIAHGSVKVWSRDGTLLAIGGQTAIMSHMVDPQEFEKLQSMGALGSR
jgi:acyl-CoA thioesterase